MSVNKRPPNHSPPSHANKRRTRTHTERHISAVASSLERAIPRIVRAFQFPNPQVAVADALLPFTSLLDERPDLDKQMKQIRLTPGVVITRCSVAWAGRSPSALTPSRPAGLIYSPPLTACSGRPSPESGWPRKRGSIGPHRACRRIIHRPSTIRAVVLTRTLAAAGCAGSRARRVTAPRVSGRNRGRPARSPAGRRLSSGASQLGD